MRLNSKAIIQLWLPALITLWAAFLRWHELDQVRTLWDDSYPMTQALRGLSWGEWPALGQQATFFLANPPGQAYFSVIPWLVFGSPWGVFWFVAALSVLAVPLLYRLGRELWDQRVGLIAAFLFAVSPWIIRFSRWTASNSLTPVATTLTLTLLLTALARPEARRLVGAFATLAAYTQTYTLGLMLMPIQFGALVLMRIRHIPRRAFFVGAAIFALVTGLYAFNLWRHWESQAGRLQALARATEGRLKLRSGFLHIATIYVTGREYRAQPLPPGTVPRPLELAVEWASYALWMMLALGVVVVVLDVVRRRSQAWCGAAVLVWWLIPLAALSIATRDPYPWHALNTVPAGHLLAAFGVQQLWGGRRWLALPITLAGLAFAVIAFANFQVDTAFNRANPVHPDVTNESLDRITLRAALDVGAQVRRLADEYGAREYFANLPEPTLAAWSGRPWHTVWWMNDSSLIVAPLNHPALYVRLGRDGPLPTLPFATRAAALDLQNDDVVTVDVIRVLNRAQAATLPAVRIDWPSDTGRTLLGYSWSDELRAGQTITLTTFWLVENLPPNASEFLYGPYIHLNAADGATLTNTGGQGIEGYYLRTGDILIQPIRFEIPADLAPGDYGIEIGVYDGVHQAGATFFPPDQSPRPFYTGSVSVHR